MIIMVPKMKQNDDALRLLAQMYARWFMHTSASSMLEAYERIRDVFYAAVNQQDAYEHLAHLAASTPDAQSDHKKTYEQARDIVAQVIQMGGSADSLIVGETDGYRHLCLSCSRDEQNFQRVHFFQIQERRLLLKPEVMGERRVAYSKCQLCLQPIHPTLWVLFTFAGTQKHHNACQCGTCNRARITSLLNIYECDTQTYQVLFPHLYQVAASSKQRSIEQAAKICSEKGWYMLNKDTMLP